MSLWYGTNRTPATQTKKSNSDKLTRAKKKNQGNTWGGINRKTLAIDSKQNETAPSTWYPSTNRNLKENNRNSELSGGPKTEKPFDTQKLNNTRAGHINPKPKALTSTTETVQYGDRA